MDNFFGNEFEAQPPPAEDEDSPAAFHAQQDEIYGLGNDVVDGIEEANAESINEPTQEQSLSNMDSTADNFFKLQNEGSYEQPGINDDDFANEEPADPLEGYSAIAAVDIQSGQFRSEPEKIRVWREEHTKLLAEKDRESELKQQEMLEQAHKELGDWQRNRHEQLEKTWESNRIAEKQYLQERELTPPGSEWERVSNLCNFNPKMSKGNKDVSRMRSTLLHLKQNPRPVAVTPGVTSN